ncbi:MAG: choice-of-anchor L domain-containing protein [Flavipsychrobacter sp.]
MFINRHKIALGRLPIYLVVAVCLCVFNSVKAQVQDSVWITSNHTAQVLAQKFAGPGVIVTNSKLVCPSGASGIFTTHNSNLGLDSGIVLTTGLAASITLPTPSGPVHFAGANGDPNLFASKRHFAMGDQDLTNYVGKPTYDACYLEFDFIPQADSVTFEYIFGSEEYVDFSCSDYNDAFAFFISGPGIVGKKNLALIPNTKIPVSINSTTDVNINTPVQLSHCTNMGAGSPFYQYYVQNSGTTVTYNGFTKVFKASEEVMPCSTYHLRMVVADVSDDKLDSGVWLKEGSLSTNVPKITSSGEPNLGSGRAVCLRGCTPGKFTFTRKYANNKPLIIKYVITGSAQNGIDYKRIPDSVIVPANSVSVDLPIEALRRSPAVGGRTVKLLIYAGNNCGMQPTPIDSAEIDIWDELYVDILTPDTTICEGNSIEIRGWGEKGYTYKWSPTNGVLHPSHINTMIKPTSKQTYKLTASYPGCQDIYRSITLDIEPYPIVDAGADIDICQHDQQLIEVNVAPKSFNNYSFFWTPANDLNSPKGKLVRLFANVSTKLKVTARTPAGCAGSDSINVTVHPGDFGYIVSDTLALCPLDTLGLEVAGGISYTWSPNQYLSTTDGPKVKTFPITSMLYDVNIVDAYGCKDTLRVPVEMSDGAVLYLGDDVTLHPGERHQMQPEGNCVEFTWFPWVGLSSPYSATPFAQPEVDTRYVAHGITRDGCATDDTINIFLRNTILDIPNAFNPNGVNKELKIIKRGIATLKYFRIFNRWGEKIFETSDINKGWDGKYNGVEQPVGVYIYMLMAEADNGEPFIQKGNITLLR